MVTDVIVPVAMPSELKARIDKMVEKQMSNVSQVVRQATDIGLRKMEKQ